MRTGIVLQPDPTTVDVAQAFGAVIETARNAERMGFHSVWVDETHFVQARPAPAPIVLAAAIAAETRSLRLGLLVKPALEHPIKIAEDVAVLDNLSNGRVLFGADAAASDAESAGHGIRADELQSRFRESLDIIVNAWTGDGFAYLGRHHTLPRGTSAQASSGDSYLAEPYRPPYVDPWQRADLPFDYLAVLPKPVQIPHPAVFVIARSPESIELAAACGYSPIFTAAETSTDAALGAARFRDALAKHGRRRAEVILTVVRDVVVHEGVDRFHPPAPAAGGAAIVGTPAEVVDALKQLQHRTGFGQVLCRFQFAGLGRDAAKRSLVLFAEQVKPRLEM